MKRCTPILAVDAIEPSLPFWESLGFTRTNEVPHGDGLGFVMLEQGAAEIMLQTRASIAEDDAGLAAAIGQGACLFIEVTDLDTIEAAVDPAAIGMARRTTFYGSTELGVRTPGGHWVTFAQF